MIMNPIRFFHMRHPKGFSPELFERFRQNCLLWQSKVAEQIKLMSPDMFDSEKSIPAYEFGAPEISGDRHIVTLPITGKLSELGLKTFEFWFPSQLWQGFSIDFARELEVGYRFPRIQDDPNWRRLTAKELKSFDSE